MLLPGWCRGLELQQCPFDAVLHACFECSVVMIPIQINTTMVGFTPISLDGATLLECIHQVVCILLSLVADPKIVHNKCERDWSCLVEEQAWSVLGGEATMLCKVVFELIVCKFV